MMKATASVLVEICPAPVDGMVNLQVSDCGPEPMTPAETIHVLRAAAAQMEKHILGQD